MDAEMQVTIPEDEYTDAQSIKVAISGETTLEQESSSDYTFGGEFSIKIDGGGRPCSHRDLRVT